MKVDRMLTSNYPAVAKTLRDTFNHLGTKKCAKDPHKHTCAMMAMQMDGGLGYDDLNELVEASTFNFLYNTKIGEFRRYKIGFFILRRPNLWNSSLNLSLLIILNNTR